MTDGRAAPRAVLALDVGATRIKAALVAPDGGRLAELRRPTGRADGPGAVLARAAGVAAELAERAGILAGAGARVPGAREPGSPIAACGIAVCGAVGPDGLVTAVNIGWEAEPVGAAVEARTGVPVTVLNDAHAGALGEGRFGAARGARDYLYVSLGTGIGAAVVSGGRLLDGAHGQAGELGHVVVDPDGAACACGARGCLQTFMSAAALEARWRAARGAPLPARQIIDRAVAGDPAARALWHEGVTALADGLLTAMSLMDPGMIVLGGGLARAGTRLTAPLTAAVRARARPFHAGVELRLAALGDWSGCVGAAAAAAAGADAIATPGDGESGAGGPIRSG